MVKKGDILNNWVEESFENDSARFRIRYKKVLFTGKSPYQKVQIVDTDLYGRVLLNDDIVMVTEKDEFVYHDMISHVPLFTHSHPQKVLIIGGGDGGTAREVLRHSEVEHCDMVEIDQMVVEACQKYLPQMAQSLSHSKLNLYIEDGVQFVRNTKNKYDLILIDSTDPVGPAVPLFGESFYQDVFRILNEDGLVVAQGESPFYYMESQKKLLSIYKKIFPIHLFYSYGNMTYPGGLWSFVLGSKKHHPLEDFKSERVQESGLKFKYYNQDIHKASFALPQFFLNALST